MTDGKEPIKRDYDYLQGMSIEGWTWEFIRRNPNYREAWIKHCSKSKVASGQENSTEISNKETSIAAHFGLLFFRRSGKNL